MYFRACKQVSCGCCSLGFVLGGTLTVLLVIHLMDNYTVRKDVAGVTQILGGYSSTLEHSFQTMGGQGNIDQNENSYEEKTSEIPMAPVPNERKEENDVAGVTQILGGYSSTLLHSFQTTGGQINIEQNENSYEEKTSEIPMASVPHERKEEKEWRKALQSYSYLSISNFIFKKEKVIKLPQDTYSLQVVGDNLWIIDQSSMRNIEVFTRQGTRVRKFIPVKPVYNLVEADNGDLVVASGKHGLHVMDNSGKQGQVITKEHAIWQLASDNGAVYGLLCNKTHLLIVSLKHVKGSWVVDKLIRLKGKIKALTTTCTTSNRVHVRGSTIYISSEIHDCFWKFDMSGRLLQTYGRFGMMRTIPGKLYRPHLCGVDIYNVALVADLGNKRIKLCNVTGQWKMLSLDEKLMYPWDVVIDPKDNGMWIAVRNEVLKFLPSVN